LVRDFWGSFAPSCADALYWEIRFGILITAEHRTDDGEVEYFVKWDNLSYAEATWESGKLIARRNPEVIEIYKRQDASNKTPSGSSKSMKSRPKFSQIKTQPDFMMGDDSVRDKLILELCK
jgi:chromodomain-helicase-DNA-binding protein 1